MPKFADRFITPHVPMLCRRRHYGPTLCPKHHIKQTYAAIFCIRISCSILITTACICHPSSVCPFVCPSVTRMICTKTAERIIKILSPSDRPIILVFQHQGSLRKSDGFTPTWAPNTRGVAIFDQYAAISRKR